MAAGQQLGYVRVSTIDQNEQRQVEALKAAGVEKIFADKASGKNMARPELQRLLEFVREGDIVYIESLSRLARDTRDLLNLLETFNSKGVGMVSLKESINTTTATGKLLITLIGAVATFERDIILERQREGIAIAKAQGKYKGRTAKTLPANFVELYNDYMSRKITKSKLAELCKVSRPVMDRLMKEYHSQTAAVHAAKTGVAQ